MAWALLRSVAKEIGIPHRRIATKTPRASANTQPGSAVRVRERRQREQLHVDAGAIGAAHDIGAIRLVFGMGRRGDDRTQEGAERRREQRVSSSHERFPLKQFR